jgi:hypothetical protein
MKILAQYHVGPVAVGYGSWFTYFVVFSL